MGCCPPFTSPTCPTPPPQAVTTASIIRPKQESSAQSARPKAGEETAARARLGAEKAAPLPTHSTHSYCDTQYRLRGRPGSPERPRVHVQGGGQGFEGRGEEGGGGGQFGCGALAPAVWDWIADLIVSGVSLLFDAARRVFGFGFGDGGFGFCGAALALRTTQHSAPPLARTRTPPTLFSRIQREDIAVVFVRRAQYTPYGVSALPHTATPVHRPIPSPSRTRTHTPCRTACS
ncbi:hypothetical protein B0H16DRAFT_1522928 [Mycena metata]|uniref:Uncharacterized protein n=1 Tax=Mycena metata TaxID=1033252 RepID=A0AAD7JNB5_9AGAR|nr:hypothetical protein B0H16DRAFT_1522928 [Mycena metata]